MLIYPRYKETLESLAQRCNALYICPKMAGKRKGPLVPYAGKDDQGRNLVGDIYFNFRRIERQQLVVDAFAWAISNKIQTTGLLKSFNTICGIPNGGRTLGQALARILHIEFVYADKKPIHTEPGRKQEYAWDLSQFDLVSGERLAIVEDVFNNFQNTDNTLAQVAATGAKPVILLGGLNRSPFVDDEYKGLPLVSAIREAYPEYKQDDPAVAEDMAAGNVEWEVKKNWDRLMAIMATT